MAENKIIVRMSKSTGIYNKSNKYEIRLNNEYKADLDYVNNQQAFSAENEINSVEIKNDNTTIVKEVNMINGQDVTFTINASVTYIQQRTVEKK